MIVGIDVEVDVEHHGERRRCHGNRYGWGGGMRGQRGGPWGGHGGPWGGRGGGSPWGGRGGHCGFGGQTGEFGRDPRCQWAARGPWGGPQPGAAQPEATPAQPRTVPTPQTPQATPMQDQDTNSETGELRSATGAAINTGAPPRAAESPDAADWTFVQSKADGVTAAEVDGVASGVENLHMMTESDSAPPPAVYTTLSPATSLTASAPSKHTVTDAVYTNLE